MLPRTRRTSLLAAALLLLQSDTTAARPAEGLRLRLVPSGKADADLGRVSFQELRTLVEAAQAGSELVLPLPFGGSPAGALEVTRCEVAIDADQRVLVLAGEATLRGRAARVFLSGTFPASGAGRYALGVQPQGLKLGEWFPALKGTPLAATSFEDAALILASAPHELPALDLVAGILGMPAGSADSYDIEAGLGLRATLAAQTLPAAGKLLQQLGIGEAALRLSGRLGSDADLLLADAPRPVDIALRAELQASTLAGLRDRLPSALRPTSLAPSFELRYAEATGLLAGVAFDAQLDVLGEARPFRIGATADNATGKLTLRGSSTQAWERPLGIPWLSLPEASLTLVGDGQDAQLTVSSTIRVGTREARLDLVLDDGPPRLVTHFEQLGLGDLAAFASERLGTDFLADLKLGQAAALRGVNITLGKGQFDLSGLAGFGGGGGGGGDGDVLFSHGGGADGGGKSGPLFAIRRRAGSLGDLLPALKGGSMDLALPQSLYTLSPPEPGAPSRRLVASQLSPAARAFFSEVYGSADFEVELHPGIEFGARLPLSALPAPLAKALGLQGATSTVLLVGSLAVALDFGTGRPSAAVEALDLHARLDGAALDGLRDRLPDLIRPTSLVPSLELRYAQGAGLAATVGFDAELEVTGERRPFRLSASSEPGSGSVTLRGETTGAWERPLGIPWISLPSASLTLTGDGATAQLEVSSTLRLGSRECRLDLMLDDAGPRLVARPGDLAVSDLADFVTQRVGSPFLKDLQLGDAARLSDVVITLARREHPSLELTGTVALGNARADLLFSLDGASGKPEPLFALRRRAGSLGDLLPALAGSVADLKLPEAVYTLTPPKPGAPPVKLVASRLAPAARAFLSDVYGSADFEVELHPGIQFGARLPMAALPPALVQALGIQDASSSLLLEGSLAIGLNLGTGLPSAKVEALELHAELPRVAGATSRLPEGLPAWMRPDSSKQSALTLRYAAPSSLTFLKTTDVLADLDGATRNFVVSTEVSAGASQGGVALTGRMAGEWKQPFGLRALALRDITLSAGAQAGQGGSKSGGVTLSGAFDLGQRSGSMRLQLGGESGKGLTGSFSGTLDSLGIDDLPDLDLFPKPPKGGLEALAKLLGKLPPLEQPTLEIALGGGEPSVSLTASLMLAGVRAHLLAFVARGKGGAQAVFAVRPENFSLARLFPALAKNPLVAPLANLELDRFGLLAVAGDARLAPADVSAGAREFLTALTGEDAFDLDLSTGLNLEARLPADALPPDITEALGKLNQVMGLDPAATLALRGGIGLSLADLRLAAALPPIRPARAPKWLKSGELAIVLTGTPSIMLGGKLTLDADGDLLDLLLEGGVERQGANVAIALKSALQADTAWTSPFGMEWLEIRRFSGQVSIDALANVGFGGGGEVSIGTKDLDVFAWTKINAASGVPMGLVLQGASQEGFALLDLAELQAQMRRAARAGGPKLLPLDTLPDIALRDIDLLIASRAVPEEGIDSAGFKVKGDLYVPFKPGAKGTRLLAVDCGVSKEGIVAKGSLAAFAVGPLTVNKANFDLEATLEAQHLIVQGDLLLLGATSKTDLRLDRESLSLEVERNVADLGSVALLVKANFDLSNPDFVARGTLSSQFAETFGDSVVNELTDVGGALAGAGAAALAAADKVRAGADALRSKLGLGTALETIEAVARKRMEDAEAERAGHKKELDKAWKEWQDTPKSDPLLRKAREVKWGVKKQTYDEGPLSKVAMLKRRQAEYAEVKAKVDELEKAQAIARQAQDMLQGKLKELADYPGKVVVIRGASFETGLAKLEDLKDGVPLDLSLDLLFCGQPKPVNIAWTIGKPKENAKAVVRALVPAEAQLAFGEANGQH
jgi:hypothetical protein